MDRTAGPSGWHMALQSPSVPQEGAYLAQNRVSIVNLDHQTRYLLFDA